MGHGDDLIYLFDLKSVDGKPLFGGELTDPHDITVREHFTDMVAEFCKTGYVTMTLYILMEVIHSVLNKTIHFWTS